jgi:hypothetical protein
MFFCRVLLNMKGSIVYCFEMKNEYLDELVENVVQATIQA